MFLVDAAVSPPCLGNRTQEFPKESLAHPGCWVTTRECIGGSGRYLTSVSGGKYDGRLLPWDNRADAIDGHAEQLAECRVAFYDAAAV